MARNEAVGKAIYSTEVDTDGLKKGLDDAGRTIKRTGAETEKAFAQQGTAAVSRFGQSVDGIVGKLNRMAQSGGIGGAILGGVGIGAGLGVFSLVQRGIGMVTDALGDATSAAREDLLSQAKLRTSLEANAEAWSGNTEAIEATIAARTALGFADDEQRDSLAQLVSVTKDSTAALDLQRTAMDLARLRNMSLADASALLGKVYSGNTGILTRYGIKLEKGATATEALAEIQARAAGQAEAWAEQNEKAVADIRIGEAMETLGAKLVPIVDRLSTIAADVLPGFIDGLSDLGGAVAPVVEGALGAIANSVDAIGKSFTALQELLDPAGTEWDRVTRDIREQAEALGLDADAVIRYTEAEKARAKAERDRLALSQQIADIDATMLKLNQDAFDSRQQLRAQVAKLTEQEADQADIGFLNNEIDRVNIRLQNDLAPLIAERERLTGDLAAAQTLTTAATSEDARITGLATQAIADYNRRLDELRAFQESIPRVYERSTGAVNEQVSAFETFGTRASDVLRNFVGSAQAAADAIGRGPGGLVPSLEDTLERMFRTMDEAKTPWQAQWRQLAAWAKDPFSKENFQDYIDGRVKHAMRKASETAGREKKRWLEVMRAYRYIAENEWIDPMKADIEKIMFALRLADRITAAAEGRATGGGSGGTSGRSTRSALVGGAMVSQASLSRAVSQPAASSSSVVQHTGTVEVRLSSETIAAAREQGASWDDIGRMAAVLRSAERTAGARYTTARR